MKEIRFEKDDLPDPKEIAKLVVPGAKIIGDIDALILNGYFKKHNAGTHNTIEKFIGINRFGIQRRLKKLVKSGHLRCIYRTVREKDLKQSHYTAIYFLRKKK